MEDLSEFTRRIAAPIFVVQRSCLVDRLAKYPRSPLSVAPRITIIARRETIDLEEAPIPYRIILFNHRVGPIGGRFTEKVAKADVNVP